MCECEHKQLPCGCIDWEKDDFVVQVNHLMSNFEYTGVELEYTTLKPEENRRLCKIGRCRVCGKRLCTGTRLPAQGTTDGLLVEIYRWIYQMWRMPGEKLPDGAADFRDMFLALFHKEDQELVREWLTRPENQTIHQMYRSSGKGVW